MSFTYRVIFLKKGVENEIEKYEVFKIKVDQVHFSEKNANRIYDMCPKMIDAHIVKKIR